MMCSQSILIVFLSTLRDDCLTFQPNAQETANCIVRVTVVYLNDLVTQKATLSIMQHVDIIYKLPVCVLGNGQ